MHFEPRRIKSYPASYQWALQIWYSIFMSRSSNVTFYELVAAVDFLYGTAVISPYIPNNIQTYMYIYT